MGSPNPSAGKALVQLQFSFIPAMVLNAAVKLNIADIIAGAGEGAALSASEIGAKLPTSSDKLSVTNLKRLLRSLVLYNIFRSEHEEDGTYEVRYGLTPLSELLVSSGPHSMLPVVRMQLHKAFFSSWLYLAEAVLDGGAHPFDVANDGKDIWALGKEDSTISSMFNQAMASVGSRVLDTVLPEYEGFKDVGVVADVGGGIGMSLRKIIQHNPHIKGINFDLPNVVATATQIPGVTHAGGDMFESVPKGDVIYMKWILHDWTDEQSIQILKNCYKSLPEKGGKVVLVEIVVPPHDTKDLDELQYAAQIDLLMMAHTSGRERTALEWQSVLSAAGFSRVNFLRFRGGSNFPGSQYVIEAFK